MRAWDPPRYCPFPPPAGRPQPPTVRVAVRFLTNSARRNDGRSNIHTMKTRKRQSNTRQERAKLTPSIPPTIEEIRQRAHEIFMARGGTPGNELDDWLRAERELKQERAGTNAANP